MNRKRLLFLFLALLVAAVAGSARTPTRGDLKNAVFIFFSRADGFIQTYTRNGDMQEEVNPATRLAAGPTRWSVQST